MKVYKTRLIIAILIVSIFSVFSIYNGILNLLPIPISEYDDLIKKLVKHGNYTLVHDIDYNPEGIKKLVQVETKQEIRSQIFLRPHENYFLTWLEYFSNLSGYGWQIGFHYSSLSRANGNITLAQKYFVASLNFMRCFFNIKYVRGHGDAQYRTDIKNRMSKPFLSNLNVSEIDLPGFDTYVCDTNKILRVPKLEGKILVNIHADWW